MKNKIFIISTLAIALAFINNVYAVGQNSNDEIGTGTQIQQQTQQKLQDGTGASNQVQNQVQNQGEVSQLQNNQLQGIQNEMATATQRKSQVANAVQEMLQVANRNSGIGQQVKIIAQAQNQNQEKLETSLQKVQSRGGLVRFFVGPNYNEINNVRKLLEQNKEQIKQLNQIKNQFVSQNDQQILTEQTETLEQVNLEIENSLEIAQKGFSLFGWMFRMFFN
ncbi:MAG: hypothetical protein WCX70_00485 [Candidatus Paceibacterota bacterium]|jgi:hypothetical protein